jgi:hypothetical protein
MTSPYLPFQPPAERISSLTSDIAKAAEQYASTGDQVCLSQIAKASGELSIVSTVPEERLYKLSFAPHLNATVRVAIAMDLFSHLPDQENSSISLQDLAKRCKSTEDFTIRIVRIMVAAGIIDSPTMYQYSHTPMSRFMNNKAIQCALMHVWDMVPGLLILTEYFEQHGFKSPEDPKNAPITMAFGKKDADFFELMQTMPKQMENFNVGMTGLSVLSCRMVARVFPFDQLVVNDPTNVTIVDVGGGRGQMLAELRRAYPEIKGKMILQELPHVLSAGTLVDDDPRIEKMAYDFFEQEQPVQGASVYFFKWIFHDWSDAQNKLILRNMKPAMTGHNSRLLICDTVVDDQKPKFGNSARDINMILVAGKERSEKQWRELLESEGFHLEKIWGGITEFDSVLEARVD